jgi:hypothetical protein
MGRGGRSGVPEVLRRGGAPAGILYGMMGIITLVVGETVPKSLPAHSTLARGYHQ